MALYETLRRMESSDSFGTEGEPMKTNTENMTINELARMTDEGYDAVITSEEVRYEH